MKTAEEIISLFKPILIDWSLIGYGKEIIQYQKKVGPYSWDQLTLRCVDFTNRLPSKTYPLCDWYVYIDEEIRKDSFTPFEKEINEILKANK